MQFPAGIHDVHQLLQEPTVYLGQCVHLIHRIPGIGIMFPFTNNYKVGKERISKVAPFRSETFVRETGQMVVLRVGYTFEFGRKHKAGNKGLNNSDTDSGIINMQR